MNYNTYKRQLENYESEEIILKENIDRLQAELDEVQQKAILFQIEHGHLFEKEEREAAENFRESRRHRIVHGY